MNCSRRQPKGDDMTLTKSEAKFIDSADQFLDLILKERVTSKIENFHELTNRAPFPVRPTIIPNYQCLTPGARTSIVDSYNRIGVANIVVCNQDDPPRKSHVLFDVCEQLAE